MKFNKAFLSVFTLFTLMFASVVDAKSYLIPSGSMFPYFETGTHHEFTRYYNLNELKNKVKRFDVIGFKLNLKERYPSFKITKACSKHLNVDAGCLQSSHVFYTKRLIGMPGDNIKMDGDIVYINGKKLSYGRGKPSESKIQAGLKELKENKKKGSFNYYTETFEGHTTMLALPSKYSRREKTALNLKLGKDEYFVLGDNRVFSVDSRNYGVVKEHELTHIED